MVAFTNSIDDLQISNKNPGFLSKTALLTWAFYQTRWSKSQEKHPPPYQTHPEVFVLYYAAFLYFHEWASLALYASLEGFVENATHGEGGDALLQRQNLILSTPEALELIEALGAQDLPFPASELDNQVPFSTVESRGFYEENDRHVARLTVPTFSRTGFRRARNHCILSHVDDLRLSDQVVFIFDHETSLPTMDTMFCEQETDSHSFTPRATDDGYILCRNGRRDLLTAAQRHQFQQRTVKGKASVVLAHQLCRFADEDVQSLIRQLQLGEANNIEQLAMEAADGIVEARTRELVGQLHKLKLCVPFDQLQHQDDGSYKLHEPFDLQAHLKRMGLREITAMERELVTHGALVELIKIMSAYLSPRDAVQRVHQKHGTEPSTVDIGFGVAFFLKAVSELVTPTKHLMKVMSIMLPPMKEGTPISEHSGQFLRTALRELLEHQVLHFCCAPRGFHSEMQLLKMDDLCSQSVIAQGIRPLWRYLVACRIAILGFYHLTKSQQQEPDPEALFASFDATAFAQATKDLGSRGDALFGTTTRPADATFDFDDPFVYGGTSFTDGYFADISGRMSAYEGLFAREIIGRIRLRDVAGTPACGGKIKCPVKA
ncbi:hypothetical protein F4808DRAFT_463566 [Astrocystis sublimbata]|nr:hypothetical protein F4808DRAFT_463566 [Astrocystis sublimbata]